MSIDIYRNFFDKIEIYNHRTSQKVIKLNLEEYLNQIETLGAGEVLINSVNRDGTMSGMDLKLIENACSITNLPIIFSGGIGSIDDIKNAFKFNISGVSAGSFFVFYGPYKAVLISYPYEEFEKL